MNVRLFLKTYFSLMISYFIIRIAYDRIIFGYLDLRVWSLLELIIIPVGLTIMFFVISKVMKIRVHQDNGSVYNIL